VLLIFVKYHKTGCILIYLLLILDDTACNASVIKTLLAQLEPVAELADILEEIQCW
jgi:hypothetical protein